MVNSRPSVTLAWRFRDTCVTLFFRKFNVFFKKTVLVAILGILVIFVWNSQKHIFLFDHMHSRDVCWICVTLSTLSVFHGMLVHHLQFVTILLSKADGLMLIDSNLGVHQVSSVQTRPERSECVRTWLGTAMARSKYLDSYFEVSSSE